MINKELKLPDNKRLDSIYLINSAKRILSEYNKVYRSGDEFSIDYKLLDRYPTYYNLIKLIGYSTNYTQFELLTIANLIYNLKGSVQSIIKFCKYFDIEVVEATVDYVSLSYPVNIKLNNVNANNFNKFLILFNLLVTELLLTGVTYGSKLLITTKTLIQQGLIENILHTHIENELVRYIKVDVI